MLESLMNDLELKPAVVNVLIDYVLKVNNNKLNKNFIETIAGQWRRLNIETAEDAMNQAIKETKNKKVKSVGTKKVKQENILPEWFDKTIDKKQMSKEDEEEVKDLLKEFI